MIALRNGLKVISMMLLHPRGPVAEVIALLQTLMRVAREERWGETPRYMARADPAVSNVMLTCCLEVGSVMAVLGDRTLTELWINCFACSAQDKLTHCVSGALLVNDVDIAALKVAEVRQARSYIAQSVVAMPPELTVLEALELPLQVVHCSDFPLNTKAETPVSTALRLSSAWRTACTCGSLHLGTGRDQGGHCFRADWA